MRVWERVYGEGERICCGPKGAGGDVDVDVEMENGARERESESESGEGSEGVKGALWLRDVVGEKMARDLRWREEVR